MPPSRRFSRELNQHWYKWQRQSEIGRLIILSRPSLTVMFGVAIGRGSTLPQATDAFCARRAKLALHLKCRAFASQRTSVVANSLHRSRRLRHGVEVPNPAHSLHELQRRTILFGSRIHHRYGEEIESGKNSFAAFDAEPHDGETALCGPTSCGHNFVTVGKFKNPS